MIFNKEHAGGPPADTDRSRRDAAESSTALVNLLESNAEISSDEIAARTGLVKATSDDDPQLAVTAPPERRQDEVDTR